MDRKSLQHIVLKTEDEKQKIDAFETFTNSEDIGIKSTYTKLDIETRRECRYRICGCGLGEHIQLSQ